MNTSNKKLTLYEPVAYQVRVPGRLEEDWSDWLHGISVSTETLDSGNLVTSLTCTVDQAALQGLLRRLYSKGVPLISVICIENR